MGSSGSGGRSWPAGRQGRGGGADLERAVVLLFLDVEQVQRPVTVDHAQQKPVVVREREVVLQVKVRAAVDQQEEPLLLAVARQLAELAARGHLVVAELAALRAQRSRHLGAPLAHGVPKRRAAPAVLGVDVRTFV